MQTFNFFPEFISYSALAPFILRLVIGLVFVNLGVLKLSKEKSGWLSSCEILGLKPARFFVLALSLVEMAGGILLIAGAYTQIAALVLGLLSLFELNIKYREASILKRDFVFYFLLMAVCASLVLTGAGLWAIDLPLL